MHVWVDVRGGEYGMTLTRYVAGVAVVFLIVGPVWFCAVMVRRTWLAGWTGAAARLAEAVLGLGVLTVISEILGTFGMFRRLALICSAVAVGLASLALRRKDPPAGPRRPPFVPQPGWAEPVATLIIAAVVLAWASYARDAYRTGILGVDSLQYHLP
ncbi:MAG: hypothetical protein JOZ99_10850, partial [Actinobacteria bacterium]|nr:hypothetical protein [Actinomycetota bacterium]